MKIFDRFDNEIKVDSLVIYYDRVYLNIGVGIVTEISYNDDEAYKIKIKYPSPFGESISYDGLIKFDFLGVAYKFIYPLDNIIVIPNDYVNEENNYHAWRVLNYDETLCVKNKIFTNKEYEHIILKK
jgi:hypothetical protein